jgi:hypothetical protein
MQASQYRQRQAGKKMCRKKVERNVKYSRQEMLSCMPMQYIYTHTHARQCRACCTAKYKWKNKAKKLKKNEKKMCQEFHVKKED